MKITEYIRHSSVGVKLIVLLVLILCGVFVIAIPMLFVRGEYALLIGMYLQNIGMFILPALVAAMLFWGDASQGLHLNKAPRLVELLCIVALYFVATPMFNRLVEWNESISLPAAFSGIEAWMRQQEEAAAAVTEQMLQIKSFAHFLAVVLGIGLLTRHGRRDGFQRGTPASGTGQKPPGSLGHLDLRFLVQCHTPAILRILPPVAAGCIFRLSARVEPQPVAAHLRTFS